MQNDNLKVEPEKDNSTQAVEQTVSAAKEVPSVPEKFQGKSLDEIIEMNRNAERKITELAQKVKSLEAVKVAEPIVQEEKSEEDEKPELSKDSYYNDPYEYTEKRVALAERKAKTLEVGMAVIMARQDKELPDWSIYEKDILNVVKEKPYLMKDPEWTKVAYKLVAEPKRLENLERERIKLMEEAQKKAEAAEKVIPPVVDSEQKAPPPPPEKSFSERLGEAYKGGTMDKMMLDKDILTDAEKALLGL